MSAAKPRPERPFIDLSIPFAEFMTRMGCTVLTAGEALISADGKPYLDMWSVELRGAAKYELANQTNWETALLALAGYEQKDAAE